MARRSMRKGIVNNGDGEGDIVMRVKQNDRFRTGDGELLESSEQNYIQCTCMRTGSE